MAKFEEISCLLKNKNKYAYEEFLKMDLSNYYSKSNEQTAKSTSTFIKSASPYFPANPLPAQAEGAEDGDAQADGAEGAAPIGFMPDLRADAAVFQWAGISFGEYDTLLLQKSLK